MSRTPLSLTGSRQYDEGWRAIHELIRSGGSFSGRERKVTYRNLGNGRFADVSFLSGLDFDADGRAFATLDVDGDGALDLLLKNRTAPQVRVMRNTLGGRSLILELRGVKSNRDAVGARLTLVTSKGERIREVVSGSGYLSQSSRRVHFGLAAEETIQAIRIRWPSGVTESIAVIPTQGTFALMEGSGSLQAIARRELSARREVRNEAPLTERPWLVAPVPAPLISVSSRWTLLSFSASWCPPCLTERADWNNRAAAFRAAGIGIRSVDVDDPAHRSLVAAYALLYRRLYDAHREMGLPMTFLVDRAGAIVKIYQGLATAAEVLADTQAARHVALPFAGRRMLPAPTRNWNELGAALAEHGLAAPARLFFETAIRRGEATAELRNNYAAVLLESGDRAQAERQLLSVPGRPEALVNLGLLYLQTNRAHEAVAVLEKAIRLQPDDGGAWSALGMAHSISGEKPGAIQALTQAQALGFTTANQANELGILYMEKGDAALARAQFERAVALDPGHTAAHINLATYYWRQSDAASARLWLNKAKAIDARNPAIRQLESVLPAIP